MHGEKGERERERGRNRNRENSKEKEQVRSINFTLTAIKSNAAEHKLLLQAQLVLRKQLQARTVRASKSVE